MIEYKILKTVELLDEKRIRLPVFGLFKYLCKNPIQSIELERKDLVKSQVSFGAFISAVLRLWHDGRLDFKNGEVTAFGRESDFSPDLADNLTVIKARLQGLRYIPFLRAASICPIRDDNGDILVYLFFEKNFLWLGRFLTDIHLFLINYFSKKIQFRIYSYKGLFTDLDPTRDFFYYYLFVSSVPILGSDTLAIYWHNQLPILGQQMNNVAYFLRAPEQEYSPKFAVLSSAQSILESILSNSLIVYFENKLGVRALRESSPAQYSVIDSYELTRSLAKSEPVESKELDKPAESE